MRYSVRNEVLRNMDFERLTTAHVQSGGPTGPGVKILDLDGENQGSSWCNGPTAVEKKRDSERGDGEILSTGPKISSRFICRIRTLMSSDVSKG
jgi:hypothetical protein